MQRTDKGSPFVLSYHGISSGKAGEDVVPRVDLAIRLGFL